MSLLWQFGSDWRMLRMLWERPSITNAVGIWMELRAGRRCLGSQVTDMLARPTVGASRASVRGLRSVLGSLGRRLSAQV